MQKLIPPILCLFLFCQVAAEQPPADHVARMKAGTALFQQTIRPALVENCLKCHGDEKVRSGLDLSSRELLLKGGDSGAAIDLVDPANSFLLALIKHEEEPEMPPKKDKFADSLIEDFEKWIALGAPYDKPLLEKQGAQPTEMQVTESDREFWSFKPLANPQVPNPVGQANLTDIDRFIFANLQEKGLSQNPPASDRARIRRAYLDMIGLPPTPEQMNAALNMPFEKLVDELLASRHYGERWARHWLDAARFAESHGFEQDYDRKFAYHYRDFVIKALNADMPWDQFVRYNLAGDEIAPDDPLALMATGFLGAGVFPTQLTEKEFESARYDELDDMAATTGTAMLGLTIGCARCHDHKFDPIPVKDYYQFVSTFTTTIRSEIDVDLDPEVYQKSLTKWQVEHQKLFEARTAYEQKPEFRAAFNKWLVSDALSAVDPSDWTVLDASEAVSSQQATTLTPQSDYSILASGKTPARETYTVLTNSTKKAIRFIRLEALTHQSMKRDGPGRAGNGNFALTNFKVYIVSADEKKRHHKLVSARATHQQNTKHLSVASAIDSELDSTGWAVDKGGIGKDQAAVFELEKPISLAKGERLGLELRFSNNSQHTIGRFRLSVSHQAAPKVAVGGGRSAAVDEALTAFAVGNFEEEHRKTLFPIFAATDPNWTKLTETVQKSIVGKPQPNVAKVQVTSEGFPPTKHHADGRGFPHFYPQTHHLDRGDPNQKNGVAETGYLQVLMRNGKSTQDWQQSPPADWTRTSYRRVGLANWITDVENGAGHLLARVIVNRIWHHHFGSGIVSTPNDFGLQGSLPTHPGLLDYLAQRLIDQGWNLKQLHRDILLTATWQQSSDPSAGKTAIDPENQYLWRFPSRRLEAEIVRDSILAVSGQLDKRMYGPGTLDERQRRRSVYFMIKRSRLVPMMQIFDQPEPLASQGSRPSTTIAPQALLFMNNGQVVQWASSLATLIDGADAATAVNELYLRTLGRPPTAEESAAAIEFVGSQTASYGAATNSRQLALADLCQVMFSLNEFIYLP